MRKEDSGRRFGRELKLAAVQRMAMGANVSKLSRELGVSRKGLYQWQKQFRGGGPSALRGAGRPRRAEAGRLQAHDPAVPAPSDSSDELSKALARIADLERLVGQQTVDLDFFQQALQHVGGERQQSGAPGGTASTRSSRR
jgi:transposase